MAPVFSPVFLWVGIYPSFTFASFAPPSIENAIRIETVEPFEYSQFVLLGESYRTTPRLLQPSTRADVHFVSLPMAAPILLVEVSNPVGWVVLTVTVIGGIIAVIYFADNFEEAEVDLNQAIEDLEAAIVQAGEDSLDATTQWTVDMWEDYIYDMQQALYDLYTWRGAFYGY